MGDGVESIKPGGSRRPQCNTVGVQHFGVRYRRTIGIKFSVGPRLSGIELPRRLGLTVDHADAAAAARATEHQIFAAADLEQVFGTYHAADKVQSHGWGARSGGGWLGPRGCSVGQ